MSEKKRLERDIDNHILGGVISGLANYFNQDPVLFRLGTIMLFVITGLFPGLFFYLVAWVIIPRKKIESQRVDYEVR